MAKRTFHLNEKEKDSFRQREAASRDTTEMKRLQAVRLYGSNRAVADMVEVVGCTESSLRRWVQQYREQGQSRLRTDYSARSQNSRKLSEAQSEDLQQRLHEYRPDQMLAPDIRIASGKFWTVSDVAIVVEEWYGVIYQDRGSYRNLLHRCGFSYQKAERVYKSRPSVAEIATFEAELEKSDRFAASVSGWCYFGTGSDECLFADKCDTGGHPWVRPPWSGSHRNGITSTCMAL
jgi:transposase